MAETFCGKTCESCEEKLTGRCEGCKKSWGKPVNEDCEIAVCCYGKGHEACETCTFLNNCGKVRGREDMLYYRRRRKEEDERRNTRWRETVTERVELMGKWCTVLFWIVIVAQFSGLMGDTMLANSLAVIFGVAYGAALLQLAPLTQQYRTAGICNMIAAVVVLLMGVVPLEGDGMALALLLTVPGSIVSLVGDYHEFHAHAEMLAGMDDAFAKKWEGLWKWSIRMLLLLFAAVLLILIVPTLGALGTMAATMGVLAVEVIKIVYLYRMAKFFRNFELL